MNIGQLKDQILVKDRSINEVEKPKRNTSRAYLQRGIDQLLQEMRKRDHKDEKTYGKTELYENLLPEKGGDCTGNIKNESNANPDERILIDHPSV